MRKITYTGENSYKNVLKKLYVNQRGMMKTMPEKTEILKSLGDFLVAQVPTDGQSQCPIEDIEIDYEDDLWVSEGCGLFAERIFSTPGS